MSIIHTPSWQKLSLMADASQNDHLRQLFEADKHRFDKFHLQTGELLLDFSKQRIDVDILKALIELAKAANLSDWIHKMQQGEAINHTEQRAVRHFDLRSGEQAPKEVKTTLKKIEAFCHQIHSGIWTGYTGNRITDIVNIGIGGSDLGPRMVTKALTAHHIPDLSVHFVSNLDGADLAPLLSKLEPETTLFIVSSKTFTTLETLTNANTAKAWLLKKAPPEAVSKHFIAASSNHKAAASFGISPEHIFEFSDWVGGRFSLWSAIGLPIALATGFQNFSSLLEGAALMDEHFFNSPFEKNMPLMLALLTLWNTDFLRAASQGIFPYSQSLSLLPAYLQQLEMESNGKCTNRVGQPVPVPTCPIIWGEAGTNGQHSFFQLLHQGGQPIPCDFICITTPDFPLEGHHVALLANCLGQSAALAFGQTAKEADEAGIPPNLLPFRTFPGNQPSNTLILKDLSPKTLGQLLALYEHKVFCLGILWNLNSFDQWGVELGKQKASQLIPALKGEAIEETLDSSTLGLIKHLQQSNTSPT